MSRRDTRRDTAGHGPRHARDTAVLTTFRRALLATAASTAVAACLMGCASEALTAYDRAAAMGLVRERIERPYARLNDGAPWSKVRRVEVSR